MFLIDLGRSLENIHKKQTWNPRMEVWMMMKHSSGFAWFGNHLPFTFMNQASNLRTGYRASFGARFGVESQIQLGRGESKLLGYGGVIHIFLGGEGMAGLTSPSEVGSPLQVGSRNLLG